MGFSKAQKEQSRKRILDIASRQIKERGIESVALNDLMKDAGLTKGAFYGHFKSRDDLILEATKHARTGGLTVLETLIKNGKHPTLGKIVDTYLNMEHVHNPQFGCVVCSLAGESKSQPESVRAELTDTFNAQVNFVERALKGKDVSRRAIGIMSAIIGAVSTARTVNDLKLAQSILDETRRLILRSGK